ncbi:MAG TPA: CD1871A family CXXC motif-containing protein [Lachnospiraceae bacterium]|nr:CD1871A family CXXC motif-containing protein [Lachnospiraceae bacterium]HPF30344.1 CD1871A family CXXC motif-containing protein [Lachnospiraceae bacterium]
MKHSIIRRTLIVCGIGLMVLGIYRGEAAMIWQKAVYVCLECIGIG